MRKLQAIAFWSSSGNTENFCKRLEQKKFRVYDIRTSPEISEEFVLICPTYSDGEGKFAVPKPVIKFLNNEANRKNVLAVIGTGNKNFGKFYGFAADVIAHKLNIPILFKFELRGTEEELENCERILNDYRSH